jgi:hypothetical protein
LKAVWVHHTTSRAVFLLNNQLTDFSFALDADVIANHYQNAQASTQLHGANHRVQRAADGSRGDSY